MGLLRDQAMAQLEPRALVLRGVSLLRRGRDVRLGRSRLRDQRGMLFLARPGDVHEIRGDGDDPLGITYWGFTLPHRSETPDWLAGFTDPEGPVVVTDTESVELALRMMVKAVESGGPRSDVRTQSRRADAAGRDRSAFATAPAGGFTVDRQRRSRRAGDAALPRGQSRAAGAGARPRGTGASVRAARRQVVPAGDRRDGRRLPATATVYRGRRATAGARRLDRRSRQGLWVFRPAPFHSDVPGPVRRQPV